MTRGYVQRLLPALTATLLAGQLWLQPHEAPAAPVPEKDQERIEPEGVDTGKDADSLLPHVPGAKTDALGAGHAGGVSDKAGDGGGNPDAPVDIGPEVPPDFQYEEEPVNAPSLEELISEDVPDLEAVELSEDAAKRALDAFAEVYGKFDDAEIAKYPTLQEFAEKSPQGKKFAETIRKHGFKSVKEWNNIITNIGFAFSSIEEGHDDAIFRRIKQVEERKDLPKERKEKLLKYLRALIPSINNRKVLHKLMADPAYMKKLDLLEGGGGE